MNTEWFDIVDEENQVIRKATRQECHSGSKPLHPVVHIHVFNSDKKLLLQKRCMDKDIQPGKWDTSIGGHIQSGEVLEDAVAREALEEAGIHIEFPHLIMLDRYVYESDVEKELIHSYAYVYDGPITFQKSEIDEMRFFTCDEINDLVAAELTTPNFVQEFALLRGAIRNFFGNLTICAEPPIT
jgi:isopentenyl-diphosphate delta-isomerase type 1